MPRITEVKKIYRQRTEQEMRNSLQALIRGKQTLHIPPREEDDDFVLSDAIAELVEARKIIAGFLQGAGVEPQGATVAPTHLTADELRLYDDIQFLPVRTHKRKTLLGPIFTNGG